MRATTLIGTFALAALAALAPACAGGENAQTMPPVVVGLTDTVGPAIDDGQDQVFQVSKPVELPLRRPKDGERPEGNLFPYPRPPFQLATDVRVTVRFTLSNLDDKKHVVELLIDPWNEFVRYVPGFAGAGEDITPNLSGIDRYYVLPPLGRIEGIITPDDIVELGVDLGTAMVLAQRPPGPEGESAGPGLFNRAFNIQNRSSEPDPLLQPFYPQQVAGIIGFDLGLRTTEAAKIAVEATVDIEDVKGDRMVNPADPEHRPVGRPGRTLSPPAAPAE